MRGVTKTCLLCHKPLWISRMVHAGKRSGRGGRLFCHARCRGLYHFIQEQQLKDNPRFAPPLVKQFILDRDNFTCTYCGRTVTYSTANIDHMNPWPRGKTKLENLVTACKSCNRLKLRRRMRGIRFKNIRKKVERGLDLKPQERRLVRTEILAPRGRGQSPHHPDHPRLTRAERSLLREAAQLEEQLTDALKRDD